MSKRFFTVEEARELLPLVRSLVEEMVSAARNLDSNRELAVTMARRASLDTGGPEAAGYVEKLLELADVIKRLRQTGCLVKDLRTGLVDFPHLREGREVFLCWKLGEQDILFWHEVDEGYAGRRLLRE